MKNLIILIGPSASGKSTVANALKESLSGNTAVFDFDIFRETFLNKQDDYYPVSAEMLMSNVQIALNAGYDVIVDGFYRMDKYPDLLENLLRVHPENNYIFYFDFNLETTIKRHAGREKSNKFGEKELKDWYYLPKLSDRYNFEYKIPESFNVDETIEFINEKLIAK